VWVVYDDEDGISYIMKRKGRKKMKFSMNFWVCFRTKRRYRDENKKHVKLQGQA